MNTTTEKKATGQQNGSQMRITNDELELIRRTFGGNEPLLKLMRKIFLPELDPTNPIGQNIDLWMTIPVSELSVEEAVINLKARNSLISHLDQQLMTLKVLSEREEMSDGQARAKAEKDSAK